MEEKEIIEGKIIFIYEDSLALKNDIIGYVKISKDYLSKYFKLNY